MIKTKKGKSDLDLINFAALGGGNVGAGLLQKGIQKFMPSAPPTLLAAGALGLGYLLTTTKDKALHFLGYGMISRGFGDGLSALGIGEDMLSDELSLNDDLLADELADELAAEMEAELAADGTGPDGSY